MSRPFTRKGAPLVVLGLFAFTACSLISEPPPPQAPGPTIINNTPPSDGSAMVLLTVLIVVGLALVGLVVHKHHEAKAATARATTAENTVAVLLGGRPNALPRLNGQYVYPDMHPAAAMRMPVAHPQMPILERGQQ